MKKILLILLCYPMIGFGQSDDVLKLQADVENINYRIDKHHNQNLKLQTDVKNINFHLARHHKQFYNGVLLSLGGFGVTAVGVLASINPFIYIGSALVLSGNIVAINSHKWFNINNKQPYNRVQLDEIETANWLRKNKDKSSRVIKRKTQLDNLLRDGAISQEDYNNAVEGLQKFD